MVHCWKAHINISADPELQQPFRRIFFYEKCLMFFLWIELLKFIKSNAYLLTICFLNKKLKTFLSHNWAGKLKMKYYIWVREIRRNLWNNCRFEIQSRCSCSHCSHVCHIILQPSKPSLSFTLGVTGIPEARLMPLLSSLLASCLTRLSTQNAICILPFVTGSEKLLGRYGRRWQQMWYCLITL